jgi:hypothetical protein
MPHLMATRSEETHLNKYTDSLSLRQVVEKVFAGFAAVVIITFISAGTVAMCFPGIA